MGDAQFSSPRRRLRTSIAQKFRFVADVESIPDCIEIVVTGASNALRYREIRTGDPDQYASEILS